MNLSDFSTRVKALSFPVDFDHVKVGTKIPFGSWSYSVTPVSADDDCLIKGFSCQLRLFIKKMDKAIFSEVEAMFSELGIVWTRDEPIYIEESKAFEVDYNFGFIGEE